MFRLQLRLHGAEIKEIALDAGREYTFGRGSACDVQLEKEPGISRKHFRLFEEGGLWHVEVLSKFGDITHRGQSARSLTLEPGAVFNVVGYEFRFLESDVSQHHTNSLTAEAAIAVGQNSGLANPQLLPATISANARVNAPLRSTTDSLATPYPPELEELEEFEGNTDVTRIITAAPADLYIRIVDSTGEQETLKLEGRRWIAGREAHCEILLNDRKASRRQFELTSSPQGYFVRDLESSNGTSLNGMPLPPGELRPIRSGDAISVGGATIYFEVRDPQFDKKLMLVPQEIMRAPQAVIHNPYEMINYPIAVGPGGAVQISGSSGRAESASDLPGADSETERKRKMRLALAVGAAAVVMAALFMSGEKTPERTAVPQTENPFRKLSPQEQRQVKETYVLAKNLYMQGKLDLAADQLKKLHEILPQGYENSLAIADECRSAAAQAEQLKFLEAEKKRQEENRRVIEANIVKCERLSITASDPQQVLSCLEPTINLEPGHPMINDLTQRVQTRIDARKAQIEMRRDYQERVSRGRSLYLSAQTLEQKGDILKAITAYRKHMESSYPDPSNLKPKSQRAIVALSEKMENEIQSAIKMAEQAYADQRLRDAIDHLKRAKKLDPKNFRAAELNARYRRELTIRMKELYAESVIAEGLGNIPQAKDFWQRILETDHPEGEYYKKARSKLRSYGSI